MGAVKMQDVNLHIFKKNTDAHYTHRGFLFQYALTLELWLTNYLSKNDIIIYCEVEDDIKTIDIQSSSTNYKQAKCYSNSLSLSDKGVQKSLYNFFLLYLQSGEVYFDFISSSKPSSRDKLLNEWMKNMGSLSQDLLLNCEEYIYTTIGLILKEESEKALLRIHTNSEVKIELKNSYQKIKFLLDQSEVRKSFIERISWTFMELDPQESVINIIASTKTHISKLERKLPTQLLYSRLLTEVVMKSANPDPKARYLDNNLFGEILEETIMEMHSNTNSELIELIGKFTYDLNSIKVDVSDIDNKVNYHLEEYGIKRLHSEFIEYSKNKLKEFSEPIFNENFNLFDIFVLPEHKSYEFKGEFKDLEEDLGIKFKSKKKLKDISVTELFITETIMDETKKPIFVHGDPGVGKSTFSKFLFSTFIEKKPDIITIHIDLKRFKFVNNFKIAIKQEFEEILPSFKLIHLKKSRFLIILDGFDELHLISDGQMDDFLMSLNDFQRDYSNVNIVLTGRTIVFQEYLTLIPKGSIIVEIKHFSPLMIIEWVKKWSKLKNYNKELSTEIININKHMDYYRFNNEDDDSLSNNKTSISNVEEDLLVSLPLFLYLICTMLYEDNDLNLEELNQLEKWQFYKRLMDWTCATSKFDNSFNPFQKHMDFEALSEYKRTFNKNISLSMYKSNKFHITNRDIQNRGLLPKFFESLILNSENLISSFIVLNYMKINHETDINETAFEFVHKSFYEYLAAEALLDILLSLANINEQDESLKAHFYTSFSGFKLSNEILQSFLIPMLGSIESEKLRLIYNNLNHLYNNYVKNHQFLNEENTAFLKKFFLQYPGKADNKITLESNVLFSLLRLLPSIAKLLGLTFKVNLSDLSNQLRKVVQFSNDVFTVDELRFDLVDLQNSEITNVSLVKIELESSNLSNSIIKFSDLSFSNLNSALLSSINIQYSDFEGANFDFAELKYANISETNMIDTSFVGATLTKIKLYNSDLTNSALDHSYLSNSELIQCDLSDAVMDDSHIEDTIMIYVNLSGASMQNSVFINVNLSNSFLSYSQLCRSKLQHSKLTSCDLRFADLYGADLSNVDLSNADLSNVDLTDANLENAILTGANLTNSTLSNTNLRGCNLTGCIFNKVTIENVDFSYSILDSTDLTTSQLNNCIFYKTSMRYTRISTQDFSNISNMKCVDFSFSTISFSNFNNVNLEGSDLSNTKIYSCLFESANFNNCKFHATKLKCCKMPLTTFLNSKVISTNFIFSELFEANFGNTVLQNVRFKKTNLSFSNIYNRKKDDNFLNVQYL
ncbi:pentapeptide repeat-containing protein [Paenibacillus polymyxa]|uniref:pentapeptide repeat-containing protein n=2 Tax=Paenibacillus TaxID=44249 RepID=UPI00137683DC|nr:pentapeptide repeat-containing protein [Paenibacillus polymyxa]